MMIREIAIRRSEYNNDYRRKASNRKAAARFLSHTQTPVGKRIRKTPRFGRGVLVFWSKQRESNPHDQLGKLAFCH
jgi:hypothetical protein